jgi:AbrB family looped-hinge helix DNA binding protein
MTVHHPSPYARPSKGTATERVWQLADDITARTGRRAQRAQVIDAYVAEGGNANTASTQFHYWARRYTETEGARPEPIDQQAPDAVQLRVESNGRVVIPAEFRMAMELGEGGKVTARIVDGELRIITPVIALRKLREMGRRLAPEGLTVVDEFIAEKRRDSELE